MENYEHSHVLRGFFVESLSKRLHDDLGVPREDSIEYYLGDLLARFLSFDCIYAIRDLQGKRVTSVAAMLAEGDIRANATSFEREREVHRHIGDFLLFWTGMFPEYLKHSKEPLVEVEKQGSFSYHLVSTYDHGKYREDAHTFKRLSEDFDVFRQGLQLVRQDINWHVS